MKKLELYVKTKIEIEYDDELDPDYVADVVVAEMDYNFVYVDEGISITNTSVEEIYADE